MYLYPNSSVHDYIKDLFQDAYSVPYYEYEENTIIDSVLNMHGVYFGMYLFMPTFFTDSFVRNILRDHHISLDFVSDHHFDFNSLKMKYPQIFNFTYHTDRIIYYYKDKKTGLYSFVLNKSYFMTSPVKPDIPFWEEPYHFVKLPSYVNPLDPIFPSAYDIPKDIM